MIVRSMVALLLWFLFGTSVAWVQPTIDPCYAAFKSVVAHKSLEGSISAYRLCASAKPKEGFPRYDLGMLLAAKGDWFSAEEQFSEALKIGLNKELADAAARQKAIAAAHTIASTPEKRAAIQHEDRVAEIRLYLNMLEIAPALIMARELVTDINATWKDRALLGIVEMSSRDYDAATRNLMAARQNAPLDSHNDLDVLIRKSVAEAEYARLLRTGQMALNQGDNEKAADFFATGWRLFPDRTDAGFAAVTCYLATPLSNHSLSILDLLARSSEVSVATHAIALRGSLVEMDKSMYSRHLKAKGAVTSLLAGYKSPEDLSDVSGKKLSAMESDAREALALDPLSVLAHRLLAFCLMREKKYSQAIEEYRAILKDNPQQKVWFWLSWALWKAGQNDDARLALSQDRLNPAKVDSSIREALLEELYPQGN
jgi:tetratricopeptide (TPR) repeat protein